MQPISFYEQSAQSYYNLQPSAVKGAANTAVEYNKRYLYTKLASVFDFTLPDQFDKDWFRFWLFHYGSIAFIYTEEFGWICAPYGVTKLDLYYHPARITVTNHALNDTKEGVIGLNAAIIYCMDDFYGFDDLITNYAEKLAAIDKSININLMNSNVSLVAEVDSKKEADEMKEAYGRATTGEPFVTIKKGKLPDDRQGLKTLIADVGNNFIVDQLQQARRNVVNEFLTEIGISNANTDKKERLISSEVAANNEETSAIVNVVFENLKKCFKKLNAISDLNCNVELRYDTEGGEQWQE